MKNIILITVALLLSFALFAQTDKSLQPQEKDGILYMREEEKMARDIYDSLYLKWGGNPFGNIRSSEQTHMDRIKLLITDYQLEDPVSKTNDRHGAYVSKAIQQYYNVLINTGSTSYADAMKTGAKVEEIDITDLEARIKQTQKQDIIAVYDYLKQASEQHLRAFVHHMKMQGMPYSPVLLSQERFDAIIATR